MPRVTKCPKCGLTQMSTTGQCKKCGTPLAVQAAPRRATTSPPSAPPLEENPYVPPQAGPGGPGGGLGQMASHGIWHDGKTLVASHATEFPDRCVKCNQPATGFRLRRKLHWHPSGWYALILVNILVYAIVAHFVRKTSDLRIGLCEAHRKRRMLFMGLGLALPLIGGVGCTMAMSDPASIDVGIWLGMLGVIVGLVLLMVGSNVVTAESIDERFARIRGAGPAFLASLPPFHR